MLLLAPDGRVVASSNPARYPVGRRLGDPAMGALPAQVRARPPAAWGKRDGLTPHPTPAGAVLWTAAPVLDLSGLDKGTKPSPTSDLLGVVYVQLPATAKLADQPSWREALTPRLGVGLLVLGCGRPRRPGVRAAVDPSAHRPAAAAGRHHRRGSRRRLPPAAAGVGRRRRGRPAGRRPQPMAQRLDAALPSTRARQRRRARQDRPRAPRRDLPGPVRTAAARRRPPQGAAAGSPLHPQAQTMEQTATADHARNAALLLELRPVALEDADLGSALEELCRAYRKRLGTSTPNSTVQLAPPVEHAVLRVVQEALANAIRHAHPDTIQLRMSSRSRTARSRWRSPTTGTGSTRAGRAAPRAWAGADAERVAELGFTHELTANPGRGTTVRVLLPGGRAHDRGADRGRPRGSPSGPAFVLSRSPASRSSGSPMTGPAPPGGAPPAARRRAAGPVPAGTDGSACSPSSNRTARPRRCSC